MTEIEFDNESPLQPEIVGPDDDITVKPVFTDRLQGEQENDNLVHSDLCGNTKVEKAGEKEWNVTIEALVLLDQLADLVKMRPTDGNIDIVTDASKAGIIHENVNFDRFVYEQTDELNSGQFSYKGETVTEPLFKVTLKSKDDDT